MTIHMNSDDLDWQTSAMAYLARLGAAEHSANYQHHLKSGRKASTYRPSPSAYMTDLIECTKRNDEEGFKARKMLEGYASVVGI